MKKKLVCHVFVFDIFTDIWNHALLQQNSPSTARKPLHPDNKKHHDEEDSWSVTSSYPLSDLRHLIFLGF
jgi:hypothetical protein